MNHQALKFLVLIILVLSCSNPPFNKPSSDSNQGAVNVEIQSLDSITRETWKELKIDAEHTFSKVDSNLYVDILFIKNYFLLDETNKLIYSYLLYKYNEATHPYDSVYFRHSYSDLTGGSIIAYDKNTIEDQQNMMAQNEMFRMLIIYLLDTLNTNEVIGFNQMIEDLRMHYFPGQFNFEGSFWLLVYKYIKNCCDKDSIFYKYMETVRIAASYPEASHRPDVIQKIMERCAQRCP